MGQATSQTAPSAAANAASSSRPGCPVPHDPPAQCPVPHNTPQLAPPASADRPAKCPIDSPHSPADPSSLNLLNHIPAHLSSSAQPDQRLALPTDRESSTIPRPAGNDGSGGGVWEYPSPQQFYNALVRKGWETPEEHVEMMVQIHNFLNERAWDEVIRWEKRVDTSTPIELVRFKGRPGELSPKARFWMFAGWLLPSRFNSEPPFDRHDWIVRRPKTGEEVRYVIDYYSAPPEPDGSPVFSLDVRPALDSVGSVKERILAAAEENWGSFKNDPTKGGAHH